ncbi:MAG: hypothetical protein AB7V44_15910, partial [Pseudonocardia sp.]
MTTPAAPARAQVQLRAAHPDEGAFVELDQGRPVAAHRRLAGHEHPVVGLDLVGHHADLVALAVVDVHVQHRAGGEHLEVSDRVV